MGAEIPFRVWPVAMVDDPSSKSSDASKAFAIAQPRRGYYAAFREGQSNFCPGCGRAHWWVGRTMAERAFEGCETAVPIIRISWGNQCSKP